MLSNWINEHYSTFSESTVGQNPNSTKNQRPYSSTGQRHFINTNQRPSTAVARRPYLTSDQRTTSTRTRLVNLSNDQLKSYDIVRSSTPAIVSMPTPDKSSTDRLKSSSKTVMTYPVTIVQPMSTTVKPSTDQQESSTNTIRSSTTVHAQSIPTPTMNDDQASKSTIKEQSDSGNITKDYAPADCQSLGDKIKVDTKPDLKADNPSGVDTKEKLINVGHKREQETQVIQFINL